MAAIDFVDQFPRKLSTLKQDRDYGALACLAPSAVERGTGLGKYMFHQLRSLGLMPKQPVDLHHETTVSEFRVPVGP